MNTENIIIEGRKTVFASRDAIDRMLDMTAEMRAAAATTHETLARQGAQMDSVLAQLDTTNEQLLPEIQREMRVVSSPLGEGMNAAESVIQTAFGPLKVKTEGRWITHGREGKPLHKPLYMRPTYYPLEIVILGEDALEANRDIEEGLDTLLADLATLKKEARKMKTTIEDQNRKCERVSKKTAKAISSLVKMNHTHLG